MESGNLYKISTNQLTNHSSSLGVGTVDSVAQSTPAVMEVESDVKRVVDVTIPVLSVTEKDTKSIPYGFADTNASIDRGAKLIKDLPPKICKAAYMKILSLVLQKPLKRHKNF